jgi:hypothetical protein
MNLNTLSVRLLLVSLPLAGKGKKVEHLTTDSQKYPGNDYFYKKDLSCPFW